MRTFLWFLKEKMRSRFEMRSYVVNEAKKEKLQVFEGNKRRGIFVSIR